MPAAATVLVVNSHVAYGAVGGRMSVAVLEHERLPAVAAVTVLLPWHPGLGRGTRSVPAGFDGLAADLARAPWLGSVRGVLTGYLGSVDQVAPVAALVDAVRAANREALYLCDPVIGDADGLYVPEAQAAAVRELLVPRADIVTPNRAELAWLAGEADAATGAAERVADAARRLARPEMLVTSAQVPARPQAIGVAGLGTGFGSGNARLAYHRRHAGVPHGTGDLFAALYLARRLGGSDPATALRRATAACAALAEAASRAGADTLPVVTRADLLDAPPETVGLL